MVPVGIGRSCLSKTATHDPLTDAHRCCGPNTVLKMLRHRGRMAALG